MFAFLMLTAPACSASHHSIPDAGPHHGDPDAPVDIGLDGSSGCVGFEAPICYWYVPSLDSCCLDSELPATCSSGGTWYCPVDYRLAETCRVPVGYCGGYDASVPPDPYYVCDRPSDCVVTANNCCAPCGRPTASDMAAVNADRLSEWYRDVACPETGDEAIDCLACSTLPNPNLIASCSYSGTCDLTDIETSSYSECSSDDDLQGAGATVLRVWRGHEHI